MCIDIIHWLAVCLMYCYNLLVYSMLNVLLQLTGLKFVQCIAIMCWCTVRPKYCYQIKSIKFIVSIAHNGKSKASCKLIFN